MRALPRRAVAPIPHNEQAMRRETRTWCGSSFVPEPGPAGADPSAKAGLCGPGAERDEERGEGEQQQEDGASCGARQVDGVAHPRGGGCDGRKGAVVEESWLCPMNSLLCRERT